MIQAPHLRPLGAALGTEVLGVDLAKPLEPDTFALIDTAFAEHPVLVFRDQDLGAPELAAFGRRFGVPRPHALTKYRHADCPEVSWLTNVEETGQIDWYGVKRATDWHTDSTFENTLPRLAMLHAKEVPSEKGGTMFADMRAAYDALDEETKALVEDLVCEHSQLYSRQLLGFTDFTEEERERLKPVRQRLVRTHPVTGRKSLYLSSHAGSIVGWPVPEARGFLRDLIEHATTREFVYSHKWAVGDLVMWDNRQMMHRGRRSRRTKCAT
jgi:alpha-ketoglutarate-dependent 2,4-dichlorophenoxyacetate dioxygenase